MKALFQQLETDGLVTITQRADWLVDVAALASLQAVACHPEMLGIVCQLLGPNISVRRALVLPDSALSQAIGTTPLDPYVPRAGAPMYSIGAILCMEATRGSNTGEHIALETGDVVLIDRRSPRAVAFAESVQLRRGMYLEYALRWLAPCPRQTPVLLNEASTDAERQLFSNHGFWNTFGPQPADVPLAAWMKSNGITRQGHADPHAKLPTTVSGPRYEV
ncbi:hypothetical protein [Ralstonia flaminis]|jgi:hypothetical protein|uniref:Uncharacterized protein n=1 Tax=Ralstonia flaminis TaxID=3058597 RepID=A0ABN9JP37_9RALS|nr:hypothetical protein [Ralstonia sp. LMG 18101]CAJ0817780.1 hypothetical protein LMG18101_03386 [Ralstonia sp. LMG 18101]